MNAYEEPKTPESQVKVPAILLIVTGVCTLLANIASLALHIIRGAAGKSGYDPNNPFPEAMQRILENFGIVLAIVGFLCAIVILLGGIKMMKLESRGLVMTAAILSMLPNTCCCLLTIPVGIWVLVVLNKPEVSAAFRGQPPSQPQY